jgi:hypothetical protein
MDAQVVISRRLAKLAEFDAEAMAEAQLMVAEKVQANAALMAMAMTGGLGTTPYSTARKTVSHYQKAVGKNRRRLKR